MLAFRSNLNQTCKMTKLSIHKAYLIISQMTNKIWEILHHTIWIKLQMQDSLQIQSIPIHNKIYRALKHQQRFWHQASLNSQYQKFQFRYRAKRGIRLKRKSHNSNGLLRKMVIVMMKWLIQLTKILPHSLI